MVIFKLRSDNWEICKSSHVVGPDPQGVKWKDEKETKKETLGIAFHLELYRRCSDRDRRTEFEGNLDNCYFMSSRGSEFEKAVGEEWEVSNVKATEMLRIEKESWQPVVIFWLWFQERGEAEVTFEGSGMGIEKTEAEKTD